MGCRKTLIRCSLSLPRDALAGFRLLPSQACKQYCSSSSRSMTRRRDTFSSCVVVYVCRGKRNEENNKVMYDVSAQYLLFPIHPQPPSSSSSSSSSVTSSHQKEQQMHTFSLFQFICSLFHFKNKNKVKKICPEIYYFQCANQELHSGLQRPSTFRLPLCVFYAFDQL